MRTEVTDTGRATGGLRTTTERVSARPRHAGPARGAVAGGAPGAPLAAIAGGLLWVPYGVFEMLAPLGTDAAYDAGVGYEVVSDRLLHFLYSLPGALGVLLCAVAVLGLTAGRGTGPWVRRCAWAAAACGAVALLGVLIAFDPLFTGPRVLGTLLLGLAALLAARSLPALRERRVLAVLGCWGIALMPLWPLVYALQIVPAGVGAAVIAGFGFGWVVLGARRLAR